MPFYAITADGKRCEHKHRTEEAAQKCVESDPVKYIKTGGFKREKPKSRATRCSEALGPLDPDALETLAQEIEDELCTDVDLQTYRQPTEDEAKNWTTQLDAIVEPISNSKGELESLRDELQEWFDNLPEAFQGGSKGDALTEAVSGLEDAINYLEEAEGAGLPEITQTWASVKDDLESCADSMKQGIDSADGVEFPGMF